MRNKYYLVCDYREKFGNNIPNDHYSMESLRQIQEAIVALGNDCSYFGGTKELIHAVETGSYDKKAVYLNFNDGIYTKSKRGQAPMLLELMRVKYSGSSPLTHLAASNKYFTNKFLADKIEDLFIPNSELPKNKSDVKNTVLQFPIIIKPNDEGSSLGINELSVCHNTEEAINQYCAIKNYGKVLIQEFIGGYELTNYFIRTSSNKMLFNELLLIGKNEFAIMNTMIFTYNDKAKHLRSYYNPTEYIDNRIVKKIKSTTKKIASSLNILSIGRVDYRYFEDKLYFIEVNTVPAFSKTSEIGELCKLYGINYEDIVRLLLKSID